MTKTKEQGGLGFRDIECFNDALLAKLSWRILESPSCLLARVLRGKYFHDQDFLQVQTPASCSHGWRGILIGRNLIKQHLGWAVGNGEKIMAWTDDWLSMSEKARPMGPIPESESNLRVADLISPETKDWNKQSTERSFPLLTGNILSIKTSKWGGEDKRVWLKHRTGTYSTKTGYYSVIEAKQVRENLDTPTSQEWLNEVWKLQTAPKLKLFLWKIKHRALPVGDRLEARHVLPGSNCIHCDNAETILHLFFQCPYAKEVWESVPLSGGFAPMPLNNFEEEWNRLLRATALPPTGLAKCPLAPWILWSIWSARNQKLFQKRSFSAQETLTKALVDAKEWMEAQEINLPRPHKQLNPQSRTGFEVIVRSDAAWKRELQAAGLAWSFYGTQRERISSHNRSTAFVISSLVAEGLAIRAAMEHAIALQMKCVVFESDSLQLVKAIADRSSFSDLHGIISDIYLLFNFFDSVSLRFCRRDAVNFEDSTAKQALADFDLNRVLPASV
ncbi:hypothetical protein Bca52824_031655 [Brassica carinata]|uniref:Reverse transcriptase zinc-binding domain-containing protein n=1 Tax=Brassica carinata TaxID=52824 RepID=A0A8X7S9K5_BRACI|nr:hypothetical protein Bca52824_031655 [Brassica carinata]